MAIRSVKATAAKAASVKSAAVKATSVKTKSAPTEATSSSASPATPTKSPAKPTRRRATPKAQSELTPIRVHYNVGMGNRITVRGDTVPFRWDCGIDTQNAADDIWELQLEQVPAGQTFEFKPLVNDTTYSTGDNYVGTGGQTLDIYPAF